jgi:hypothetical protein
MIARSPAVSTRPRAGASRKGQLSLASKIINSQVDQPVVRQYIDGEIDAVTP